MADKYVKLDDIINTLEYEWGYEGMREDLQNLPTADVVEVKHGEWIRQKGRPEAICSECGREVVYQTIDNRWQFEDYCPHCGAKMDGTPQKEG